MKEIKIQITEPPHRFDNEVYPFQQQMIDALIEKVLYDNLECYYKDELVGNKVVLSRMYFTNVSWVGIFRLYPEITTSFLNNTNENDGLD